MRTARREEERGGAVEKWVAREGEREREGAGGMVMGKERAGITARQPPAKREEEERGVALEKWVAREKKEGAGGMGQMGETKV